MKLKDFVDLMQELAPAELAMDFDNVGLLIGPERDEIKKVLVALDCTRETAMEAVDAGADLLLTHHPRFLFGVKRILPDDPETAGAYTLIRHGIGLFAAHTNLDSAPGGVNDALCAALGIENAEPFPPEMMGRIGNIAPAALGEFAALVEKRLDAAVRVCGNRERRISRVAVLGGAGGEDAMAALRFGAEVFVTGEMKHHQAIEAAEAGLSVIEAGHYETERVALLPLIERLQERSIGVQYNLTRREASTLSRL